MAKSKNIVKYRVRFHAKKTWFRALWIIILVGGGLIRLAGKGGTVHIGTGGGSA